MLFDVSQRNAVRHVQIHHFLHGNVRLEQMCVLHSTSPVQILLTQRYQIVGHAYSVCRIITPCQVKHQHCVALESLAHFVVIQLLRSDAHQQSFNELHV